MVQLIIASGYAYPYRNVTAEFKASLANAWFPSTIDFRATAGHSGGAKEAGSFDELLKVIGKMPERSVKDLGLVGHANQQTFALSGKLQGDSIIFDMPGMIHKITIQQKMEQIKAIRNRFVKVDASITLYACDAGADPGLLEEMSKAFEVLVRGFKNEIWWCFTGSRSGGVVRGRTWYDGVGAGLHPDCDSASFSPDVRVWVPENKSFAGVQIDL